MSLVEMNFRSFKMSFGRAVWKFCLVQFLVLPHLIAPACGLRVLGLFPDPRKSHLNFFEPITKALIDANHHVTVVSAFPEKFSHANYENIALPKIDSVTISLNVSCIFQRGFRAFWYSFKYFQNFSTRWGVLGYHKQINALFSSGFKTCKDVLSSSAIDQVVNKHFDVILMEHFNTECLMGIAWKMKLPVIGLSSCMLMPWHYDRIGNPLNPSYIPNTLGHSSQNMSFGERLVNWATTHTFRFLSK